ncbi:MAG: twin-arginine translocase subunit TatC [Gammaproteobacteria bacterium]|nr:twin-arginine translocase subunit TatC [Gammaproteobacteria bacterium]
MTDPKPFPPTVEQPLVKHLIEMRDRLLRVVLVVVVIFLGLFAFANDLYSYLAEPLLRHMPEGVSMIATEVASPFLTPFKLTLVLSAFLAVPYILYQAWGFIAPGLYQREQRLVFPLLISSTLLFYAGMAFAYFVVFPLVFGFLIGIAPEGVEVMTDISRYLDFVLKMFFAFGLAFEVPIATILVVWSGLATAEDLAAKRPYIIVGAFVFGMLLTPPDVISQTLLALPMWILFELGLVFSRWYTRKPESDAEKHSMGGGNRAAAAAAHRGSETNYQDADASDTDSNNSNNSGHEEYEPLSDEDMDAELDRIEAEEARGASDDANTDATESDKKRPPS